MKSYDNSDTSVTDVICTLKSLVRTSLQSGNPTCTLSWTVSHSWFSAETKPQGPSLTGGLMDVTRREMLTSDPDKG